MLTSVIYWCVDCDRSPQKGLLCQVRVPLKHISPLPHPSQRCCSLSTPQPRRLPQPGHGSMAATQQHCICNTTSTLLLLLLFTAGTSSSGSAVTFTTGVGHWCSTTLPGRSLCPATAAAAAADLLHWLHACQHKLQITAVAAAKPPSGGGGTPYWRQKGVWEGQQQDVQRLHTTTKHFSS